MIERIISDTFSSHFFKGKALILQGPRQVGKTTLIRQVLKGRDFLFLDGDDPSVRNILVQAGSFELKQIIGLPEETLPKEKSKRIALFKTMAIDPLFQNQGYGTALTDARLKGIESMGIKTVFAIAWKTDQTINMFTILSKHGFQEVATLKNYWRADSLEKKYVCPACGGPPCTCDAVIFKKTSTLS